MIVKKVLAIINFLSQKEGGRQELPLGEYRVVARFDDDGDWSVRLHFSPDSYNGKTALAQIEFLMPQATRHLLKTGRRFSLWEGREVARGEVLIISNSVFM